MDSVESGDATHRDESPGLIQRMIAWILGWVARRIPDPTKPPKELRGEVEPIGELPPQDELHLSVDRETTIYLTVDGKTYQVAVEGGAPKVVDRD